MNDDEFENYLNQSLDEMEEKQGLLTETYGMGSHERFTVDYEKGELAFFDGDLKKIECVVIPVASHAISKNHLKFAWANESYPEDVKEKSAFVKNLSTVTALPIFNKETLNCDESMAWEISAMACRLKGAKGVYRVPHGELSVYVVVTSIKAWS